jgi:prophage tail gpP-like protein
MGLRVVRPVKVIAPWPITDGERAWKRCSNIARALNLSPSVEANGECALSGGRQSKATQ